MSGPIGRVPAPTTYPRDEPRQPCKRSCCWTPITCATAGECACHVPADEWEARKLARLRAKVARMKEAGVL